MNENEEFQNMIDEMFDEYIKDGFDFNSSMTFEEVFKTIFTDAITIAINTLDAESDE